MIDESEDYPASNEELLAMDECRVANCIEPAWKYDRCIDHQESRQESREDLLARLESAANEVSLLRTEWRRLFKNDALPLLRELMAKNAAQAALLAEARLAIWSFIDNDPPHLTQEEIWGMLTELDAALKEPQA